MPVVTFHLVKEASSPAQRSHLLTAASQFYSDVLAAPIDRIRAFITLRSAEDCAVAGEQVSINSLHAPFFEFIVLEGRPLAERQQLMSGFTRLLAEIMQVDPGLVRGRCIRVHPEDWCIGGSGADQLRKQEIEARAAKPGS